MLMSLIFIQLATPFSSPEEQQPGSLGREKVGVELPRSVGDIFDKPQFVGENLLMQRVSLSVSVYSQ